MVSNFEKGRWASWAVHVDLHDKRDIYNYKTSPISPQNDLDYHTKIGLNIYKFYHSGHRVVKPQHLTPTIIKSGIIMVP